MRIAPLFALPLMMLSGSSAYGQQAPTVVVQLANFKFTPNTITLDHGRPYVLRLANVARGSHDFTASKFFAAAAVAPAGRRWIRGGVVEVPSGQVREIHVIAPPAGSYPVKCSHSFHKMFGMSGKIMVR